MPASKPAPPQIDLAQDWLEYSAQNHGQRLEILRFSFASSVAVLAVDRQFPGGDRSPPTTRSPEAGHRLDWHCFGSNSHPVTTGLNNYSVVGTKAGCREGSNELVLSISDPGVIANVERALVLIWPRSRSSSGKRYRPAIDQKPFRRPQPCLNFTDRLSRFDSCGACDSTNDAILQMLPACPSTDVHRLSITAAWLRR